MDVTTKDVDLGWQKAITNTIGVGKRLAAIGVLGGQGDAESGITLAGIATANEFGAEIDHPGGTPYMIAGGGRAVFLKKGDPRATGVTGPHKITLPERSFFRSTLRTRADYFADVATKLGTQIADGTISEDVALGRMGLVIESEIKATITRGVAPPNAASTIRRKKSSKPLIDTGRLRASITSEVRDAGEP